MRSTPLVNGRLNYYVDFYFAVNMVARSLTQENYRIWVWISSIQQKQHGMVRAQKLLFFVDFSQKMSPNFSHLVYSSTFVIN